MRKKMRTSKILGLAILSLALTECAVQEVEMAVPAGINFEVFATPTDTRTVNSGLSTLWVSGDKFNLFHAKAGTTTFSSDGAFTVDDEETGHATGSVSTAVTSASDWYMVYPYAAGVSSPKAVSVKIGATAGAAQVQAEADDMGHLAGTAISASCTAHSVRASETPASPSIFNSFIILRIFGKYTQNPREIKTAPPGCPTCGDGSLPARAEARAFGPKLPDFGCGRR